MQELLCNVDVGPCSRMTLVSSASVAVLQQQVRDVQHIISWSKVNQVVSQGKRTALYASPHCLSECGSPAYKHVLVGLLTLGWSLLSGQGQVRLEGAVLPAAQPPACRGLA